jgi:hypothetical protein
MADYNYFNFEFIERKENEYLKRFSNLNHVKSCDSFVNGLIHKNNLNFDDLIFLRKIAVEQGFYKLENRQIIYDKIFKLVDQVIYHHAPDINQENVHSKDNSYRTLIKADLERSVLNKFISTEHHSDSQEKIKSEFSEYLNEFYSKYEHCLNYYQGIAEISLYFYFLKNRNRNIHNKNYNFEYLFKFNDLYIKDFSSKKEGLEFTKIINILNELILKLDPKIHNEIFNITNTPPYYALSWIITWFAHKNHDIISQYRIIDYLICSPQYTIYYMVALVNID